MHQVAIRKNIIDRVVSRRGKFHLFDHLSPQHLALVVIDMQNTFLKPGGAVEVPMGRNIVSNINKLAENIRSKGGTIIWIAHANQDFGDSTDWSNFFDYFVSDDMKDKTIKGLRAGEEGQDFWHELDILSSDIKLTKNRYSALISGSSNLERYLRSNNLDTLLIAGTKTNVCCDATGRDAMMLDFKTVMVSDCLAALSDEEHLVTLETFIQQFGDVMSSDEVLRVLK
tara:strand:- start:33699 stop:34379 length:681 start_codon:yes stop_codon:yes gene_type:complete